MVFPDATAIRVHQKAAGARKRGDSSTARPARGSWPQPWRARHQRLRDRRRLWSRSRVCTRAGSGARAAAGARAVGPPATTAQVGGGRPRLHQPRIPRPCLAARRASGDPAAAARDTGCLPGLDLQQSQPGRAPLKQAEGMAGRGNPPREDCHVLPVHTLLRRYAQPGQAMTDPRTKKYQHSVSKRVATDQPSEILMMEGYGEQPRIRR